MAMEKVVIASNIPTFNEFITSGENGFIAKTNDDYIHYIDMLFNNQNLQTKIGINARKNIIQNYNIENTINETLSFYQKIIQQKND